MNFQRWLSIASSELIYSTSPYLDAEILLSYVTGKTRTWIIAFSETELNDKQIQQLAILLTRRKKGEPIAYLIGEREFWSMPIYVSPATLIPRPDTECLVEQALICLPSSSCRVLDLGTGTGAIALALASERPDCQVVAVDLIPDAIKLARRNINRLKIKNIYTTQSSWFSSLTGQMFKIIISNPPYIDKKDSYLSQNEIRFEPHTALVAKEDGLADIRHIVATSHQYLQTGGWLIVEHGWKQGNVVRMLFTEAGFQYIKTNKDYGGNDRLTFGQWL